MTTLRLVATNARIVERGADRGGSTPHDPVVSQVCAESRSRIVSRRPSVVVEQPTES